MSKAKLLMAQSLLFTLFKIYLPIQLIIQKLIIAIKSCKKILKKVIICKLLHRKLFKIKILCIRIIITRITKMKIFKKISNMNFNI